MSQMLGAQFVVMGLLLFAWSLIHSVLKKASDGRNSPEKEASDGIER